MPGTISTCTFRSPIILPAPLQTAHILFGICPDPWHEAHSLTCAKLPKNVFFCSLTSPLPPHVEQLLNPATGSPPCPLHDSHRTRVFIFMRLVAPRNASSRVTSSVVSRSAPRSYVRRRDFTPSPSKNVSKISPISPKFPPSAEKPKFSQFGIPENPSKPPAPPPNPAFGSAVPNRS